MEDQAFIVGFVTQFFLAYFTFAIRSWPLVAVGTP